MLVYFFSAITYSLNKQPRRQISAIRNNILYSRKINKNKNNNKHINGVLQKIMEKFTAFNDILSFSFWKRKRNKEREREREGEIES